jgi:hypothetical protein
MESQMKRIHMLGLKRPLAFVVSLYRFPRVGSIVSATFAIDGDFDAGRRRRGRASGRPYLISCFICPGPLCARTNVMPRSAPALLSICMTVSRPLVPSSLLGTQQAGMQLLFRKDWQVTAHQVGCEQNTKHC